MDPEKSVAFLQMPKLMIYHNKELESKNPLIYASSHDIFYSTLRICLNNQTKSANGIDIQK